MRNNNRFIEALSTRSKNALLRCFGGREEIFLKPEIIAEAGPSKLKMTNQLGFKSLKEIAGALYKFRYITDLYEWLKS